MTRLNWRRWTILVTAALLAMGVAAIMYQRRDRAERWCAQYFDALGRQHNPDLAKLTATVIEGFSIDLRACRQ